MVEVLHSILFTEGKVIESHCIVNFNLHTLYIVQHNFIFILINRTDSYLFYAERKGRSILIIKPTHINIKCQSKNQVS